MPLLSPEQIERLDFKINYRTLNELVDHHLLNAMVEAERPESVVKTVMAEYIKDIRLSGNVPSMFFESVFEELEDIVIEIVRKRTYGFLTIGAYKTRAGR
jgi:hypothetical protein